MKDTVAYEKVVESILANESMWKASSKEELFLCPGLTLDEGKPCFYELCDSIHSVAVISKPGFGKTNLLNNLLINITREYSPNELEVFLIDGRNCESVLFAGEHYLPHAKYVVGTRDAQYVNSILKMLITDQVKRVTTIAGEYKTFTSFMGRIPRRLLVIDEWQELAKDNPAFAKLLNVMLQLAYLTGYNLILSSQSTYYLPEDCDEYIAHKLYQDKKGKVIVSVGDEKAEYLVPFLSSTSVKEFLKGMHEKCKEMCIPLIEPITKFD